MWGGGWRWDLEVTGEPGRGRRRSTDQGLIYNNPDGHPLLDNSSVPSTALDTCVILTTHERASSSRTPLFKTRNSRCSYVSQNNGNSLRGVLTGKGHKGTFQESAKFSPRVVVTWLHTHTSIVLSAEDMCILLYIDRST